MKTYYEISASGINELAESKFKQTCNEKQNLYLMDLQIQDRQALFDELKEFDIKNEIIEFAQNPSQHIRLKTIDYVTYGELAYFRKEQVPPLDYIGIITKKNLLILIHDKSEHLSAEMAIQISAAIQHKKIDLDISFLVYILIHEILTNYAELILSYREEIEAFSRGFINESNDVNLVNFLKSRSRLSIFSQVFEKLFFTLSFPPVKNIVDKEGPYQAYFSDLMKTILILKESLNKIEERLNSLHDHYLLTLQDKSNKRINFLTIIQAIFVPLTLLAGIYGMNFQNMPELEFQYGYYIFLGVIVVFVIGFLRYFHKNGWFDQ